MMRGVVLSLVGGSLLSGCGLISFFEPDASDVHDGSAVDAAMFDGSDATPMDGSPTDAPIDGTIDAPADAPMEATAYDSSLPPAAHAYFAQASAFTSGGTIDLTGDGTTIDTVTINADGSETDTVARGGHTICVLTVSADGVTEDWQIDGNGDGTFDETWHTDDTSGTTTSRRTLDTDFDGTFDHRETTTTPARTPPALPMITRTVENWRIPTGGTTASWQVDYTATDSLPDFQCMNPMSSHGDPTGGFSCNPFDGYVPDDATNPTFPTYLGSPFVDDFPNIRPVNTGMAWCKLDELPTIAGALGRLNVEIERIGEINAPLALSIFRAVNRRTVTIACDVQNCGNGGVAAVTSPWDWFSDRDYRSVVIARGIVDLGVEPVAETILHEFIHVAGVPHENGDPAGDHGRDIVYACARYGNACTAYNTHRADGAPFYLGDVLFSDSAHDAAHCALEDERLQFGDGATTTYQTDCNAYVPGQGSMAEMTCEVGSSAVACACCERSDPTFCDRSFIPRDQLVLPQIVSQTCCSVCSAGTSPYACQPSQTVYDTNDPTMRIGGNCMRVAGCGY